MATTGRHVETEIKLAVSTAEQARRILRSAGFRLRRRRAFERNDVYDTAGASLRSAGKLLRLRTCGRLNILTFKGPPERGRHKSREEWETSIGDPFVLAHVLEGLGFTPTFRYEKYRSEYKRRSEPGTAALDETPIGVFLELEGPPAWIDRTAARMGFRPADYVTSSYAALYYENCERRGLAPAHLVFKKRN
jgi:adenylate cyclase class 2